jgi:leucyl-tRNA synthetase
MHLLYTRFFTKAMRDLGLADIDEPMVRLYNQGIVLGEDSEKMSKSRGNVINPDDLVARYGADSVRAYLMFFSRWDQGGPWSSSSMEGIPRFLNRVWGLVTEGPGGEARGGAGPDEIEAIRRHTHQTVRKVSEDLESFSFNTAVAALMSFSNALTSAKSAALVKEQAWDEAIRALVLLLAPMVPHLAEELWERLGGDYSVHQQAWPAWDEELARPATIEMPVQVNGRVRARFQVEVDAPQDEIERLALEQANVQTHLGGKAPRKVIVVPNRLVNVVV